LRLYSAEEPASGYRIFHILNPRMLTIYPPLGGCGYRS
jgi:hypothetical protein